MFFNENEEYLNVLYQRFLDELKNHDEESALKILHDIFKAGGDKNFFNLHKKSEKLIVNYDVGSFSASPLLYSVANSFTKIASELVEHGVDVHEKCEFNVDNILNGNTIFMWIFSKLITSVNSGRSRM